MISIHFVELTHPSPHITYFFEGGGEHAQDLSVTVCVTTVGCFTFLVSGLWASSTSSPQNVSMTLRASWGVEPRWFIRGVDLALLCCRSLQVVDPSKGIADVPEWFRGSRLNYAENLLRHGENDRVALYVAREWR